MHYIFKKNFDCIDGRMYRLPLRILRAPHLSESVYSLSHRIQASSVMAHRRSKTTKAVIFDLGGVVVPSPLAAFIGIQYMHQRIICFVLLNEFFNGKF